MVNLYQKILLFQTKKDRIGTWSITRLAIATSENLRCNSLRVWVRGHGLGSIEDEDRCFSCMARFGQLISEPRSVPSQILTRKGGFAQYRIKCSKPSRSKA